MQNRDFAGMHCVATRTHCALVVPRFEVKGQTVIGPSKFKTFRTIVPDGN